MYGESQGEAQATAAYAVALSEEQHNMTWLRGIYSFFYEIIFGCSHGHLTRPFTFEAQSYKVCLDCGRQLPYSLEMMRIIHPWEVRKLHAPVTELTPVSISSASSAFSDEEDYRGTKAIA